MKRCISIIMTLILILIAVSAFAESVQEAVLGEAYTVGDVSAKLIAYHVEHVEGSDYIYVEIEFTNNGSDPISFENAAWLLVTQDDEECGIHTVDLQNIKLIDPCLPGNTETYINAYMLNDLTTEVIIDMFPADQLLVRWDKRQGEIFYHIDIVNEPKAIADGYEWEDT
ncbi:MAG: DUF5067 domain-containing protein [Ruminococcus sp.]|nr:DUF5067 domain-containing protein [Ruminococcus sp.]